MYHENVIYTTTLITGLEWLRLIFMSQSSGEWTKRKFLWSCHLCF